MSTSSADTLRTLRAWRQQRFAHTLFVPVALTLVVASVVGNAWPDAAALAPRAIAAWLAVLALRLWDDLEDRERDATVHPKRILTAVTETQPYMAFVAGLLVFAGVLVALGGGTGWVLMALVVVLWGFYRLDGQTWPGSDFVILLKYPVLVLTLGGTVQPPSLVAQVLVLVAVCIDEVLQRSQSSSRKLARGALLAVTFGTLLICSCPHVAELIHV